MRCGECNQRNSVAAGSCAFCGQKFQKKNLPASLKISVVAVGLGLIVGVSAIASSIFSSLGHSNVSLKAVAQHISAGPKNSEEANKLKSQLERVLKEQLITCGNLPSGELLTKLQSQLPNAVFEVFVFDLPRGMKVVEVDCVLQSTDFLISQDAKKQLRVDEVRGLGVFDEARLINSGDGSSKLILLGHNNIEMKRLPTVKVFDLDAKGKFTDMTAALVPPVSGQGNAQFIGNLPDIKVEGNLVLSSQEEKLFTGPLPAKEVNSVTVLRLKDGKYKKEQNLGSKEFSALYAVASSLVSSSALDSFKPYLTNDVIDFINAHEYSAIKVPPSFSVGSTDTVKKRKRDNGTSYLLTSADGNKFAVTLAPGRGGYVVTGIRKADLEVASALPTQKTDSPLELQEQPIVQEAVQAPAPVVVEAPKKEKNEVVVEAPKKERKKVREKVAEEPVSARGSESGVAVHNVSMRSGPKRGHSLGIVRRGDKVRILGKEGSWYRVSANGTQGYVWSGMIRKSGGVSVMDEPSEPKVSIRKAEKPEKVAKEKTREVKEPKVAKSKPDANKLVMVEKEKEKSTKAAKTQPDRKTSYVDKRTKTAAAEEPTFVP